MKIAIGCDHGGYLLKQDILIWLEEHDIDFEDVVSSSVLPALASPLPPTRSRVSAAPTAPIPCLPR